jgi:hypothetical protein
MKHEFDWMWHDPSHFEAHRQEFARPVEEILQELRPKLLKLESPESTELGPEKPRRWVHREWELPEVTGRSGLRRVTPAGGDSFWAYREGRRIPSHLTLGERELTHWICLWGWWEPGAFVIHTIYPGRKAPREIHDPELSLDDLPEAIEFWRTHAIVTEQGAFTFEPRSR